MQKDSYITKLLTLLVSRSEGKSIRIPASELFSQDVGQGITVYWDEKDKSLVLSYLPSGAKTYVISEATSWLANQLPTEQKPNLPLTREEMLSKVWMESAGTPTVQELANQRLEKKGRVVHLEDEDLALAEVERRKREIMKSIEESQPPSQTRPAVVIPSSNRTTFYKQ